MGSDRIRSLGPTQTTKGARPPRAARPRLHPVSTPEPGSPLCAGLSRHPPRDSPGPVAPRPRLRPTKPASCPTVRHAFATHLLESVHDCRPVQEFRGHTDVKTTMARTHGLNRGGLGLRRPVDALECIRRGFRRKPA